MALLAVLVFLVVPVIELWVIVEVAGSLGVVPTLALLVAVSVVGALLVRRAGLSVWRRSRTQWSGGRIPTDDVLDGVLVLGAAVLLLTPGFVTDTLGLLLLIPPVRRLVGSLSFGRIRRVLRIPVAGAEFVGGVAGARRTRSGRVWVGEAVVVDGKPSLVPPDEGV